MKGPTPHAVVVAALCAVLTPAASPAFQYNLIPNGDFNDLADMDIVDDWYEIFSEVSEMNNLTDDADDCFNSVAADGINTNDEDFGGAVYSACATEVVEGESYVLTGMVRFHPATSDSRMSASFFFASEENCFGSSLGGAGTNGHITRDDALDWKPFVTSIAVAPAGAKSIRVDILLTKITGTDPVADLYFDKIYLTKADYIFADDFEFDAVACRWSSEVGFAP